MTTEDAFEIIKNRPFDPYHQDLKALRVLVLDIYEKLKEMKTEELPRKRGKNA